jgi:hypothetical protein
VRVVFNTIFLKLRTAVGGVAKNRPADAGHCKVPNNSGKTVFKYPTNRPGILILKQFRGTANILRSKTSRDRIICISGCLPARAGVSAKVAVTAVIADSPLLPVGRAPVKVFRCGCSRARVWNGRAVQLVSNLRSDPGYLKAVCPGFFDAVLMSGWPLKKVGGRVASTFGSASQGHRSRPDFKKAPHKSGQTAFTEPVKYTWVPGLSPYPGYTFLDPVCSLSPYPGYTFLDISAC